MRKKRKMSSPLFRWKVKKELKKRELEHAKKCPYYIEKEN